MSVAADVVAALRPVVSALDRLGVAYEIGGSIASSVHGMPRATMDVDLVADLHREQVDDPLAAIGPDFYSSREVTLDALRDHRAFNLIHRPTMIKVDVFPVGDRRYDRIALERGEEVLLADEPELRARVATPEDVVLRKLEWSRHGDSVSEVQWRDVLGILQVQGNSLDLDYLRRWAAEIDVLDLLEQAIGDRDA